MDNVDNLVNAFLQGTVPPFSFYSGWTYSHSQGVSFHIVANRGPPVDLRLHNSTNLVTLVQLSLGFTLIGLVCANQLLQTNLCRKGM